MDKKLTKEQYATVLAMTFATVAMHIAPVVFAFLAYHFFGVPGLLLGAFSWCISETITETQRSIERAAMHAKAMRMMQEAVERIEREKNGETK